MADTKVSALTALGEAPATNDLLYVVDVSAGISKSMTVANLFTSPTFTTPVLGTASGTQITLSNSTYTAFFTTTENATGVTIMYLDGFRAGAANNDAAYISLRLKNSAGARFQFAYIGWQATDITNGSEDGQIILGAVVNGTIKELAFSGTSLITSANDLTSLGTATVSFSDLFLASGGVINWANGNATLTHATGLMTLSVPFGVGVTAVATAWIKPGASTTGVAQLNLPTGSAPTAPVDGDVWREDNTNTGLKIRINGVTKTVTVG